MDLFTIIYTGTLIILMFILMAFKFNTVGTLAFVNLLLYTGSVLNLKEMLSGFSNNGILTVVVFYPLLIPIINSLQVNEYSHRVFMWGSSKMPFLMAKIVIPVFFLSFFINNTPVVYLYLSFIKKWCTTTENYASLYLIPLSYASILGGTNTLVGTSTNLLADGLVSELGYNWNIFQTIKISILPSVAALITTSLLAKFLLPSNVNKFGHARETRYKCQVTIPPDSILVGMNARNWIGGHLELVKLKRQVDWFAITEETHLQAGDELLLYCSPDELINFVQEYRSHIRTNKIGNFNKVDLIYKLAEIRQNEYDGYISEMTGREQFYKIIPSQQCPINGTTIGNLVFENNYLGIVFAVSNQTIKYDPISDMTSINDTQIDNQTCLLVYSTADFIQQYCNSADFTSITRYRGTNLKSNDYDQIFRLFNRYKSPFPIRNWHISAILFMLVIIISSTNVVTLLVAATTALLLQAILGIVDLSTVINSIQWSIYLTLALSVPIGTAVVNSEIDQTISSVFTRLNYHLLLVLAIVGLVTMVLTNLISNATTVTIMVPIAYQVAKVVRLNPSLLMLFVTCLSSVALVTPYSYQTNLMVQKDGTYDMSDYAKIGSLVSFVYYILSVIVCYLLFLREENFCPTITPINNTWIGNSTTLNTTVHNASIPNNTILNASVPNTTMLNTTMLNSTMLNSTMLNSTMLNT